MQTADTASVENLIRTILERRPVESEGQSSVRNNTGPEEIIFDCEIDGFRYLIIRMPKPASVPVQLSPREREIVRLVALGHSNKIIADVLSISSWTVSTHLRRIFSKLGVGSRAAMVAHLAERGRGADPAWMPRAAPNPARNPETKVISRGDSLRRVCV